MNMSEFIANHPQATKKEIEDAFDGNLCRCTGYRAILTGMKTFAADWTLKDEQGRMICLEDACDAEQLPADVVIPFPPAPRLPVAPVTSAGAGQAWRTPTSLAELAQLMARSRGEPFRLVHGNTSFGVYKDEFPPTKLFIDIRLIPELHAPGAVGEHALVVGAGTSYGDLIDLLETQMQTEKTSTLAALHYMARRTAGRIVRNAASLGGNTMLVLKHIAAGTGAPFPSDLFTALVAVDAKITYLVPVRDSFQMLTATAGELVTAVRRNPALADRIVLAAYSLPLGDAAGAANDVVLAQKVALREVNAHSIVNATTRITFADKRHVTAAALVFGGIAPYPWRAAKTEAAMAGPRADTRRRRVPGKHPGGRSARRAAALAETDGGSAGRGFQRGVPRPARRGHAL